MATRNSSKHHTTGDNCESSSPRKCEDEQPDMSQGEETIIPDSVTQDDIAGREREITRNLRYQKDNWSSLKTTPSDRFTTIALVGLPGVGKSTLGNLLLGKQEEFRTSLNATLETKRCQLKSTVFREEGYNIIDTPASVTWQQLGEFRKVRWMMDEAPGDMGREGIHVFVLVMNASGFGRREREIHDLQVFSEAHCDRWMVVATHGTLSYARGDAQKFIEDVSMNPKIKDFMEKIKSRVVLVDCGSDEMSSETDTDVDSLCKMGKEQSRDMVFHMIREVSKGKGIIPAEMTRAGPIVPSGSRGRQVQNSDVYCWGP